MKQVVQNYRSGELLLVDVPIPDVKPGGILVKSEYSLISTGTEIMKVEESRLSMLGKARARPEQVRKVVQSISQQGLAATYRKVESQLDSWTPLGYSLAGRVVEVGEGVDEFKIGQRVACAGNQFAFHAEVNWVPKNLCVQVPDGVNLRSAAFTTVGAVAMQGLRQSEATLGEVAVVIGLGLVGQLLSQILGAAGVRVVGIDPALDRCRLAERLGVVAAGSPSDGGLIEGRLRELSSGSGADHVFITAGGNGNDPVELAVRLARDRGRVVDIGKVGMNLPWKDYYEKELEVRFSRSYGPGRYDPTYEEKGVDYPLPYVRWTERRNMESFLSLLEHNKVEIEPLISAVYPIDQAVDAYNAIATGKEKGVGVLFQYEEQPIMARRITTNTAPAAAVGSEVRLSVIGAGNYASSMLLPHLAGNPKVHLVEVVTTTPLSAANAHRRFGFDRFGTDVEAALADPEVDAFLVATRHDSHAELVCQALSRGKAVFVEKPLAVNVSQLQEIVGTIESSRNDRVMVGFNRRFAPLLNHLRNEWQDSGPVHFRFDVNAGRLAERSWYADPQHGSRLVGEGGHFIDTASWWIGADPVEAFAVSLPNDRDNAAFSVRYSDGSVASISYFTDGHARYPKETIQIFGQGRTARFDNFRTYELWTGTRSSRRRSAKVDKGQKTQLDRFIDSIEEGLPMPIAVETLLLTTAASLAAERSVGTGALCSVEAELTRAVAVDPSFEVGADLDSAQAPSDADR